MRKYIRHPSSIPVELSMADSTAGSSDGADNAAGIHNLSNIGEGGFACAVQRPLPIGARVELRIPLIWPDYRACGVVAWCRRGPPCEIGIAFSGHDLFKTKMIEQLCQIEDYRRQLETGEGRTLSSEAAAREWIALYAQDFSTRFHTRDEGAA